MQLPWITDPHLNFLDTEGPRDFGLKVREAIPDLGAVLVTGDIGEYPDFNTLIESFAEGVGAPVYFVLGNHDAYRGSIVGMRVKAEEMAGKARWLPKAGTVELAPGVALVGHDGWYDARLGDPKRSNVVLSDFMTIRELLGCSQEEIITTVREIADAFTEEARILLEAAVAQGYKRILFATHVPPYAQATWHQGQMSDKNFLPWMSNRSMGEMLDEVTGANPDVEFTVFCGHTHSAGRYERSPNLLVRTGHAAYGYPRVTDVLTF
jgi:UDP-2,3-diacylglucosamine pyrophosphatase LpxH